MHRTYEAVVKGNLIEWQGDAPPQRGTIRVHVTLMEATSNPTAAEPRRAMLEALEGFAASGVFADIKDPVAWQREIRKDRPLSGRED